MARHPRSRDFLETKKDPELMKRDWMWENGSTVCDKYLRHKTCSRAGCQREHRSLCKGETRPLCWNYFVNRDGCIEGVQCPLSHDAKSVPTQIPDRGEETHSPISSSPVSCQGDDTDKGVSLWKKSSEKTPPAISTPNPILKAKDSEKRKTIRPVGTYEPPNRRGGLLRCTNSQESSDKARFSTNSRAVVSNGPTVSTPFSPPTTDKYPSHRRWKNGASHGDQEKRRQEASQLPATKGLTQATNAEIKALESPRTEKPNNGFVVPPAEWNPPESTILLDHTSSASERPSIFNNPSLKDDSSAVGGVSLDTPPQESDAMTVTSVNHRDQGGPMKIPTLVLSPKPRHSSDPTSGVTPSRPNGNPLAPFYSQFHEIDAHLEALDPSSPGTLSANLNLESEFNSLVSRMKDLNRLWIEPSTRISEPPVSREEATRSIRPPSRPRAAGFSEKVAQRLSDCIPEWDLFRCFNCFEEGHCSKACNSPYIATPAREELREKLGVINRKWTDFVISNPYFPPDIVAKHRAYRRIWQPYTSKTSRRLVGHSGINFVGLRNVSPNAVGSTSRHAQVDERDEDFQKPFSGEDTQADVAKSNILATRIGERNPTRDQGSQTDKTNLNSDHGTQTDVQTNVQSESRWDEGMETLLGPGKPIITGKNHEKCWLCGSFHSKVQPCDVPRNKASDQWEWDEAKWARDSKGGSPLQKNTPSQRSNPKQRTRRTNNPLSMAKSRLLNSSTTTYRIDNGEKEIIFDREDLTMLRKLDDEAKRVVEAGADNQIHVNSSLFARCPNEILEEILTYAADEYASENTTKVKDIIAGHDFRCGDGVRDNIRRAKNLAGVAKTCRQLRIIAQHIIYKVVCIDKYKSLRKFALSLTADPDLGKMVQVVRVNLEQTIQSYRNRGQFRYQMDQKNVVSNSDFSSLFVRVVESCPNMQVLSTKMFGSLMGFAAIRGRFLKMREICISDPASAGQVLNRMWNHLTNFPRLRKFKIVHSDLNDAVNFEALEIPYHMVDRALNYSFRYLNTLTLENAPEISDDLLFFLVRRLTALTKLAIVNCKLVTSGGLARVLEEIPNRLSTLVFWVWLNHSGFPNEREIRSTGYHLCSALSDCGSTLSVLNMKPYRLCEDMWRNCHFQRLHRCNIDMLQFSHCNDKAKSRDGASFEAAYRVARKEERLPCLEEKSASIHLQTSGISFR